MTSIDHAVLIHQSDDPDLHQHDWVLYSPSTAGQLDRLLLVIQIRGEEEVLYIHRAVGKVQESAALYRVGSTSGRLQPAKVTWRPGK